VRLLVVTQKVDLDDPILGFFHRWLEELAAHAESVRVVCLEEGRHALPANVVLSSLGKERGASRLSYVAEFYRQVVPLLAARRVDRVLVHMNEVYVLLLAPFLPLRRARGIRLVWWKTHGQLSRGSRIAWRFADAIATASEESFPVATRKKAVLGHGIDTTLFSDAAGALRDGRTLLVVGRLDPVKHVEDALEALTLLPDARLRVVGPPGDLGYGRKLTAQADPRATFEPPRGYAEMPALYREADVLVNTSDTDSVDKVVLEAMASGTVPVTSNHAFERMLGPHGLFVPKRDPRALADAVRRVLELDPDGRARLAAELRSIVVESHDLRQLARALASL
jgi:glycosyltransferase involved in cell wall biosynthesis